jgi:hypothetical protein
MKEAVISKLNKAVNEEKKAPGQGFNLFSK